jgi:DNA helicase II / ATP-dependent DNA helicase PcrA
VGALTADGLLDGLNEAQRAAVTTETTPLCILAGAGSGKTRVLTRRIAYRSVTGRVDPRRVLALTFTRKAASELTNRLRTLGLRDSVGAGTFHAVAYAQLRTRWAERDIRPPELLDRKVGFVARLIPRTVTAANRNKTATLPLDVVSEIEWAKARMITPADYPKRAEAARRTPPVEAPVVAEIYERYEVEKRKRRLVDFDDLLRLHVRDLKADADYAAAVRWRFQHLFVDEFQDVNPQQHALLTAWLGDRRDLCVVGDPNQAIYAWNGADARYINEFGSMFGGAEVVQLVHNYRSSPQILSVANTVLGRSAAARRGDVTVPELRANRPDGPIPEITEDDADEAEASGVARKVRDAKSPRTPWSAQAVLVRTNAQTAIIEKALRAAGIPCRLRGSGGLLEQPEVKAAMRSLQQARGAFTAALRDLELEAGTGDGTAGDDADDRQSNVEALIRLGHDYLAVDPNPSTPGFLAWLADTVRADQPDGAGDAVDVVTFHAAKGLEWPVVHLAGLEQGLVPIGHAETPAELAEERRLFYVAITRAERELHLSWANTRVFGSRTANRFPSPYLDDVKLACDALRGGTDPANWAEFLAEQRAALRAKAPPAGSPRTKRKGNVDDAAELDEAGQALYAALKSWRSETAKAGSVPAYVVLDNKTMAAIARARPTSQVALSRLPGIGPVKLSRYGDAILSVVTDNGGADVGT